MIKKLKICLPLLLVGLVACSHELKGNGKIETQARQLSAFENIDVKGDYNVQVTSGKTQSVAVTVDNNLQNAVKTEVKDKTLYISSQRSFTATQTPSITIDVDKLAKLNMEGDVKAQVNDLTGDSFAINAAGASLLSLMGKVSTLEISLAGESTLNGLGLQADKVKLHISGNGKINVNAEKDLDVKIEGAAEVQYQGDPRITQDISGVGKLIKINAK